MTDLSLDRSLDDPPKDLEPKALEQELPALGCGGPGLEAALSFGG